MKSLQPFVRQAKCALLYCEQQHDEIADWHFNEFDLLVEREEPQSCNFSRYKVIILINPSSWQREVFRVCERQLTTMRNKKWIVLEDHQYLQTDLFSKASYSHNTSVSAAELSRVINRSFREINDEHSFKTMVKGWLRKITVTSQNLSFDGK